MWHSFKVRPLFDITRDGKKVNLSRYFDTFKEDRWWETSLTIKPEPRMSDYIKKWGWQMIPEESLGIARRKVKEHPYPGSLPLLPEQLDWIKRRKKYPMSLS